MDISVLSLDKKTAVITGSSGGIGEAISRAFHSAGANVCMCGRNTAAMQRISESMGNERCYIHLLDVKNRDQIRKAVDEIEDKIGGIDILINNAGITQDQMCVRMKDEEWDEVIETNLSASFFLSRSAIKKMMKRRRGAIVNVSSVVAFCGNSWQSNYVASKAGLIGLTRALASEYARYGIRVNAIAPGYIETAMTGTLNDSAKERFLSAIPLERAGSPDDIASGALFLASDRSSFITGHTLHINGGMYMG
ncbi:3-oxoacyl-[acyl-carrier-protein] reductase [Candidatus Hydrogenosomobacter endosymbioticus]|uniref:3-oxoacyl-[acyl-carrier-protein] reductase n=1 Tax=Candidatus Hydrogenosomobacter endosymbioticus TaxID=2558174 RepID=A0ABN6L780_9PROT|nr:3-oxoacyl-[acyl-carrier-protein] reductase [Candidatus Hydrogenosomobacter endosymbioticus]BDB96032.1 beta-ketoacyl-ACP reductase [Candidatus Hydrogenosomobacter endosymbioticus]